MEPLTSRANPRLRHAARLRTGRYRRKSGEFLVDGWRETGRALNAGIELVELFVEAGRFESSRASLPAWVSAVQKEQKLTLVASGVFEKVAYGERNEGVVALFATPSRELQSLRLPAIPLLLIADQIEKPGNLGAILRSCDAFGVDAVLCSDCATDLFHPNVIRASLGTVFQLPVVAATGPEVRAFLAEQKIGCLAARVDATQTLWQAEMTNPIALVVGAEADGLGKDWDSQGVTIPMSGIADSFNVSVAAALLACEARRQRGA
ncbi:23S rRNA (guanosine-2'-O-)-methyltransferase RlmB [Roseimaritima multifibrata]|uniref:23S rRNA (Guanosine-2'-O-)-methyltransferase RlmB n=1 Tax=Roseimaritima multifibrata TaxID=1930274 RepID=A0A517M956_9BACT|nr:TrmH family RNA methyltransferase [Roseimaritima multifibrata]QDS91327.1 23S rRNA (guanosine-2'-O-)-methyltransferase RlmB [Roseimaritima multifibrata]